MHNRTPRSHGLLDTHRRLAVENLKRCPFCGTVNAKLNEECFVCRWHGSFEVDAESVEEGLIDVLEQCPELIDCILYIPRRRDTWVERALNWMRTRAHRPLDFEA